VLRYNIVSESDQREAAVKLDGYNSGTIKGGGLETRSAKV
jgi:hypothetical protein